MRITFVFVLMVMWCGQGSAKSFGVVGEVFPVVEKSFLELIEERLKALKVSGELEALNQRWIDTAAKHINRPMALTLKRAKQTKRHYYVPEITLSQEITARSGKVLYPKGTHVNALEHMPAYKPCWLFFNADDEAQLNWARLQKNGCANPKFILTGGAINVTEQRLQSVIYFDQAGKITKQLKITQVPALVLRRGNQLEIREQAIKESGHVF